MQNIKFTDLLGEDFKDRNYAVTSNWRIDFKSSPEFKKLIGNDTVLEQMSFAFHSDLDFTGEITYATASIKGIPIRQAAWQSREVSALNCSVYELVNHQLYKALSQAADKVAGFYEHRNIGEKKTYTFSGIKLYALGNNGGDGDQTTQIAYELLGAQLSNFKSPTYTSDAANIADVTFDLYAHGFKVADA